MGNGSVRDVGLALIANLAKARSSHVSSHCFSKTFFHGPRFGLSPQQDRVVCRTVCTPPPLPSPSQRIGNVKSQILQFISNKRIPRVLIGRHLSFSHTKKTHPGNKCLEFCTSDMKYYLYININVLYYIFMCIYIRILKFQSSRHFHIGISFIDG